MLNLLIVLFTTVQMAFSADASTWPACSTQIKGCKTGFYMNKLACQCFAIVQCNRSCRPGSDLIPTEVCKCTPFSDIRALFPRWATRADL